MADINVTAIGTATARAMRNMVWTSASTGYLFYITGGGTLAYRKTTDGGATWGNAEVVFSTVTTLIAFDVWYDKWTPGDSGTRIHHWFYDSTNDLVLYQYLDTSNDTVSTYVTAFTGASAVADRSSFVTGCKARNGYLWCGFQIDRGTEKGLVVSTNGGASWSSNLNTGFAAQNDTCMLFPDCVDLSSDVVYLQAISTSNYIILRSFHYSGGQGTNGGQIAFTPNATDLTGQYGFSATLRASDGHIILVACNERDTATADMVVAEAAAGAGQLWTSKTNITTNIDDNYYPAVYLAPNGDIYVAYNGKRDGSEVLGTTTKVYYTKSTDGGTTWSAGDTAYMQGAAAAVLQTWSAPMGPRFYVGWRQASTNLYSNAVNSLDLSGPITIEADGNATGTSTAQADGQDANPIVSVEANTQGTSTAASDGSAVWAVFGGFDGTAIAVGYGSIIVRADASSEGSCVATADGSAVAPTEGSVTATSTASADGEDAATVGLQEREVTTAGTSTAQVDSGADAKVDASTTGTSTAAADGQNANNVIEADGSSAGTSATNVVGAAISESSFTLPSTSATSYNTAWFHAQAVTLDNTSTAAFDASWFDGRSLTLDNTSATNWEAAWFHARTLALDNTSTTTYIGALLFACAVALDNTSTASATSGADAWVSGSVVGTSTANADGENIASPYKEVDANTVGSSTAAANSGATCGVAGSTAGASTANADSLTCARIAVDGQATGLGTTAIESNTLRLTSWSIPCLTTAAGVSGAIAGIVGSSEGTSATDIRVGDAASGSEATAAGTSTASVQSGAIAGVAANSVGTSAVAANSSARANVIGSVAGTSAVDGQSLTILAMAASASGSCAVLFAVQWTFATGASASGIAAAQAQSMATAFVEFAVVGLAIVTGSGISAGERLLVFSDVSDKVTLLFGDVGTNIVFGIEEA